MGKMVPSYLQFSLENLAKEQERFRNQFAHMFATNPFGAATFEAMQQQTRKNMQMFEQALTLWNPFTASMQGPPRRPGEPASDATAPAQDQGAAPASSPASSSDLSDLKAELARMQEKIEKLSQNRG
jgi:polyhydroxyalkanoate synthesis regulator protein